MAIDIRATVTCSLGTLISGSISDDYIQGSGLVKTRGSVEISGTITPAIGTAVTFSYTKDGVARSIPRKLRVMSSFADPFRRTTKVELGCKLTYLSDLKEPVDWTAFDDPQNAAYNEADALIVTLPIYASSVMNKCLTELGITASSNPLTNKFSIAEFDFGAGYVSVLNDLLVSESYCGYLDTNEVLQVFALDQDAGTGPVFTASDIVDLGPIGVGQLPGEAVTVSFSTLKLKDPDPNADQDAINWAADFTSSIVKVPIEYTSPGATSPSTKVFTGIESSSVFTSYTKVKDREVVSSRVTTETRIAASVAGSLITQYFNNGLNFQGAAPVVSEISTYYLHDEEGNEIQAATIRKEQPLAIYGAAGVPMVFSESDYVITPIGSNVQKYITERTITQTRVVGNYTFQTTQTYGLWNMTIQGQQSIAEARDSFTTASEVTSYLAQTFTNSLNLLNTTYNTSVTGQTTSQERPPAAERTNAAYSKDGDPNNGWRTESQADLELALGSATAQRRIELSMPYAPDDTFSGPTGGPFTAVASDAPAKANRYGRVQNRLLLGNRSGINLQLAPERLPAAPYSPLYVQANGLTALYRANGTNWAFDANGIVCSVDALFWAAVGGTGTFWFPVAPGVTTLPTSPPVVDTSPTEVLGTIEAVGATPQAALNAAFPGAVSGDGVQDETTTDFWVYDGAAWENVGPNPGPTATATSTVLPYNETAVYDSRIRFITSITEFAYSLELLTVVPSTIRVPADVIKVRPIHMPAPADFVTAAYAPEIRNSFDLRISNTPDTNITTDIPTILNSTDIRILAAPDFAITAPVPQVGSSIGLIVAPPVTDITLAVYVPQVGSGIGLALQPPAVAVTVTAEIPTITTV